MDGPRAPLAKQDIQGYLRDLKSYVADELQKHLQPITDSMVDLATRTREVEDKMEEMVEVNNSPDNDLELKDQIHFLEEANENLCNRMRRNNIRPT
ncbi:Hypothetical predicted protein [Pelobates cultripes]|uniref:Uncharacterized protein n=1 Tax=Pelobates cultripes TaxID=61616 RepID=A0AAD1WNR9_PELCU|nr:Hypothetical predicted protein [Pelobates cultripes]